MRRHVTIGLTRTFTATNGVDIRYGEGVNVGGDDDDRHDGGDEVDDDNDDGDVGNDNIGGDDGNNNGNDGGVGMDDNIDGVARWSSTFSCLRSPTSA